MASRSARAAQRAPAYALKIAPWMFRFWRACAASKVEHSTAAQTALMDLSKAELEPFLKKTDTIAMLRKEGNLQVYESEAEFEASLPGWKARERHGIEFRHLNAEQMAENTARHRAAFFLRHLYARLVFHRRSQAYYAGAGRPFPHNGGRIECLDVASLRPLDDGVEVVSHDGRTRRAGKVVLAAGAFSHRIARSLGEKIPLETERGYNTTLPSGAFDLRTQVTFGGHGFVVTRLSSGIRVGGAVELGGLELPANFARSEALLDQGEGFSAGLKTEGGKQWMGFRPSLPDSLPAIGEARHTARVIYAFGHGHLGLTQSAGTARIVADLLTGQKPAIDTGISPQRF